MANYIEDFESFGVASGAPTGFTDGRWDAGFVPSTVDDSVGISLRCSSKVTARKLLTFDAINADPDSANSEILARVRFSNVLSDSNILFGLTLRASGTGSSETGYTAAVVSRNLCLFKFVNAVYTSLVIETTPADYIANNTWYWLRFRVNGSVLKTRIWKDGTTEPAAWGLEHTDESISAGGWAGLFSSFNTTPSTLNDVSVIAVATNGDTAVIDSGVALAGASSAQASATGDLTVDTGAVALDGAAYATASATGDISVGGAVTVASPDRGTLDLVNCSVTPDGITPAITVQCYATGDAAQSDALVMYGEVAGVSGMTPAFRLSRTNFVNTAFEAGYRFFYSYDATTWQEFDNRASDLSYYYFSNDTAFTGDTVYFCSTTPWSYADTLPWIESLESSGLISEPPSSSGSGYVFATRTSTTGQAGETIPASSLYSFRVSSGAGAAPDGHAKRDVILIGGVHAGEDIGNHQLKGAVEFLVSADVQAGILRDWFNFTVYPLVATAGRRGGANREDYEATDPNQDVNRAWDNTSTLETITKHTAAMAADCSNVVATIDYHGTWIAYYTHQQCYVSSDVSTWEPAIQVYRPGLTVITSSTLQTSMWYGYVRLGAALAITSEYNMLTAFTSDVEDYGADTMRALSDIADADYFAIPGIALEATAVAEAAAAAALSVSVPLAAAGLSVATATGALDATGNALLSGTATATANATGGLSLSIPLAGSAVAQALASAGITVAKPLSGNAIAEALASAALETVGSVSLSGAAVSQAVASAALTQGVLLSGAAIAAAVASAGLDGGVSLSGAATAEAFASAGLTLAKALVASATAEATAVGSLSINVSLSGTAIAEAAASAGLTATNSESLAGDAMAQASASGSLTLAVPLTAAALAVTSASGNLTQIVQLSGSAASASMATGGLDVSVQLSGVALAQALAQAGITHVPAAVLEGDAAGSAGASGTLTLYMTLDGAALARAVAAGALSAQGFIVAETPGWRVASARRNWTINQSARSWRIAKQARNWSIRT